MITEFVGNIAYNVETGNIFVIAGKTVDKAKRLDINFQSGKHRSATIPFQLSVRFDENIIVRNTYLGNDKWIGEEREECLIDSNVTNPLKAGKAFIVHIFISESTYHVAINDNKYCTYDIKMPLDNIRTIYITGGLQAITQFDHRSLFPFPHPIDQRLHANAVFSNDVPGPFKAGHVIVLTAVPFGNAKGRFTLAFTEDNLKRRDALNFNARFKPDFVVVKNAMNERLEFKSEMEEREEKFPFVIDAEFKLAIGFAENQFVFAINGELFCTFNYRSEQVLSRLNGMQLFTHKGMHLEIKSVDHIYTGVSDCNGFEVYSNPEYDVFN